MIETVLRAVLRILCPNLFANQRWRIERCVARGMESPRVEQCVGTSCSGERRSC